jgi:hypothetical protein
MLAPPATAFMLSDPRDTSRINEKFAMQERAWQHLLVLTLPLIARLIVAIAVFARTH